MFSSLTSLVWGGTEEQTQPINNVTISLDDTTVTEDDWVFVEETARENYRQRHGNSSQEDEKASSLHALFEKNKPEFSASINEETSRGEISLKTEPPDSIDHESVENFLAEKASDSSDKSSLEILFAEVQPTENEPKEDSDYSMKTDETNFSEKSSLQFLFDESLHKETSNSGNNSTSAFSLKPQVDPSVILAPNSEQSRPLKKSYSADNYREPAELAEPTLLRRRHVTRASKRSGECATIVAGNSSLEKRNKQPSQGTSGVGRGQETKGRTRRANSVSSGQSDNNHGKRRKRTAEKLSAKGGRRNC